MKTIFLINHHFTSQKLTDIVLSDHRYIKGVTLQQTLKGFVLRTLKVNFEEITCLVAK